jgi:glycosyltransferase involved in cell wall biosynthesis
MNTDSEQLTYLVANYNNGWAFGDLLASLEDQTCSDWLCLVCDDSSTDDSLQTIRRLVHDSPVAHNFRILENERNLGLVGTLEHLIAAADTDIVTILDADDALEPPATAVILRAFRRIPKAGFVYTKFHFMTTDLSSVYETLGTGIRFGETSMHGATIGHLRSFRRRLYDETPGMDSSMLYAEDRDFIFKLEERTRPIFIDQALCRYRFVPTSQSMDPKKRRIGIYNFGRAWNQALTRRGIRGFSWLVASSIFWLSRDIWPFKYLRKLLPLALKLDERFQCRKPRRMNRTDRWHK